MFNHTGRTLFHWLFRKNEGATALEYGLLAMFIAGACVLAVTAFGVAVAALYERIVTQWP